MAEPGTRVASSDAIGAVAITALRGRSSKPVRTVLSGRREWWGAAAMARRSGFERIISFDMGGTSTDVSLLEGEPRPASEGEIAGLPVRVPMLDIHTVGAGGGSIARFDAAGALRVGRSQPAPSPARSVMDRPAADGHRCQPAAGVFARRTFLVASFS